MPLFRRIIRIIGAGAGGVLLASAAGYLLYRAFCYHPILCSNNKPDVNCDLGVFLAILAGWTGGVILLPASVVFLFRKIQRVVPSVSTQSVK